MSENNCKKMITRITPSLIEAKLSAGDIDASAESD
jgi:hypothetical protein